MVFLAPITLLGLLLVSLPVVIHLLVRRRGRRLDFPSLRFLRETPTFKLHPRRIRQPLLLLLRALAIILLVMGVARPLLTLKARAPEAVRFIVLDASLSMKTRGRAEAAREQARAIAGRLAEGERAAVIALSAEATTLAELTSDRAKLLEAIERYQPAGGAADYDAGFKEINRQLQPEPQVEAEADLISDFQASGLDARAEARPGQGASLRVIAYPVGLKLERNAFWMDESAEKTERGLELSASEIVSETDGRAGARRSWMIEGSVGAAPGIEWRAQENGQITGRLKALTPDDFDADDERFFAFAPPRETRILLIEDGASADPYLRAALEAAASREGTAPYALERRARLPQSSLELAAYSLVVLTLDGAADETKVRTLGEYARGGGSVLLFMARGLDAASWAGLAGMDAGEALPFESVERRAGNQPLRFGAVERRAPQLRGLGKSALGALLSVRVSDGYALTPRASSDTLMRWSDSTPAFVSSRTGEGVVLLLAASPERASGDLGLSPSFPALVSSILRATYTAREPLSHTIGEALRLNIATETEVRITDTQGRVVTAKARELVRRPLSYFAEPGIYSLEFAGTQRYVAFNAPVSESESALATEEELKARFPTGEAVGARVSNLSRSQDAVERSGQTWRYLLCASFLLMIAELLVAGGRRKVVEG
jgi:hypothetical protein